MTLPIHLESYLSAHNAQRPKRLGQRYDTARFLPEAGNTVVCHLDTSRPDHLAVLDARDRIMALEGAERFLFTPAQSLHMTVFEGAIETRRRADAWPADQAADAPIDQVTDDLLRRMRGVPGPGPFRMQVAGLSPGGLALEPVAEADGGVLRTWRDDLTGPFGYRHADHDAYRFHMTFSYPVDWLPDALVPVWTAGLRQILDDLAATMPVLPLSKPAYCRFADMTWFEELHVFAD
ncbi:MAG: DUF1868 domain-containing protein [Paracoccaceae bacterium]